MPAPRRLSSRFWAAPFSAAGSALPWLATTVFTLTLTGIAADSSLAGGDNHRFGRRLAAIASLFVGAAIGALLLRLGLALPLGLGGACVLAATAINTDAASEVRLPLRS